MQIDLNVFGNKIKDEKMRKAFFIFSADVATYVASFHNPEQGDDDEKWTMEDLLKFLVKESIDLQNEKKENWKENDMQTYPFDIGHRMIHIVAKQFEEYPKQEEEKTKLFKFLSENVDTL